MTKDTRVRGVAIAMGAAFCLLSYFGNTNYSRLDALYTLVGSQQLISQGTLSLDSVMEKNGGGVPFPDKNLRKIDGHYHMFFPIGSSLLAAPAVWVANRLGMDMVEVDDEVAVQRVLATFSVALTFVLMFLIASEYLTLGPAFVLAFLFAYAGPVMSIGGTAYRSHNPAMILNSLVVWSIVREQMERRRLFHPAVMGALLGFGYVCRPTTGSLIATAGIFFLLARPMRDALLAGLGGALVLGVFSAWSWLAVGMPMPPYYMPSRLTESGSVVWEALLGQTISPTRGLFVYMPFFTIALGAVPWAWPSLRRRPLFWFGIAWTTLHFAIISRFPVWWGGTTFGPRFFTDVTPCLLLITLEIWRAGNRAWPKKGFRVWVAIFLLGGTIGLYIHCYQGLYNRAGVKNWYQLTRPGIHRERFFDWHHPQFLHDSKDDEKLKKYWRRKMREIKQTSESPSQSDE
jgi:hypothetical protein